MPCQKLTCRLEEKMKANQSAKSGNEKVKHCKNERSNNQFGEVAAISISQTPTIIAGATLAPWDLSISSSSEWFSRGVKKTQANTPSKMIGFLRARPNVGAPTVHLLKALKR